MRRLQLEQRGFSTFELVIAGGLIVLMVSLFYSRYMALAADAERAAYQGVLGWLQAGLNMRQSLALSRGSLQELKPLEGSNPMDLVAQIMAPPSNYLGELDAEAAQRAPAGNWYFRPDQGLLVYRIRYQQSDQGFARARDERLAFRLKLRRQTADKSRRAENVMAGQIQGLRLVAVASGRWQQPATLESRAPPPWD